MVLVRRAPLCAPQVCTLVLCSVHDVDRVVQQVYQALKPGGTFVFIEHVAAPPGPMRWLQTALTPAWREVGDNCHLNRETLKAIRRLPWTVSATEPRASSALLSFLPIVSGAAVK